MRIGFCTNLIAAPIDGTGREWIEKGKEAGFDYIELPLAQMMDLNDESFCSLRERVASSGLKCECCNNFFPATIHLTGDAVDYGKIEGYLDRALNRAAQLGARMIVFGSPKSRNVPEGYPMDKARLQLVDLLRMIDPLVGKAGITVLVEPVCKLENNIVNTAREGLQLVRAVDRENIRLLVDHYHMVMENEEPEMVLDAGPYIRHTHFANPVGRVYPVEADDGGTRFVNFLKRIGYDGRISVEAYTQDFGHDARRSLEILRQLAQ